LLDLTHQEMVLRLVSALVLGGIVGFEREVRARPAGMRTHSLAAEGSALFTLAGLLIARDSASAGFDSADPGRIASIVVQGIGFLAAGVIFAHGAKVHGLTTAAGLWTTAAIGVLVGAGYFFLAVSATLATTIVLSIFKWFETRIGRSEEGQDLKSAGDSFYGSK
jgi:putative Mg2+ transporter-C (MgtC) family protein